MGSNFIYTPSKRFYLAVKHQNYNEARQLIQKHPTLNVNYWDTKDSQSPLLFAMDQRNWRIVSLILESPIVNLDIEDTNGETPFLKAVIHGNINLVIHLLQMGANICAYTKDYKFNAILLAIVNYQSETLQMLLNLEIFDLNFQTFLGDTALHAVACQKDTKMLKYLLKSRSINTEKRNIDGVTPLEKAIRWGNEEAIKVFKNFNKKFRGC